MRKCLTVKRSHLSKSWGRQCLSKLAQARLRKPAAEPLGEHALGELSESERAVAPAPIERSGVRASKEPEHDKNEQRQPPSVPPLPLSPLMDPQLIAARQRFRAPKPSPSGQPSAFARRLEKNAYAQALATPVRECNLTGARLPNYFHVKFGLAKHPKTGAQWHLPVMAVHSSLLTDKNKEGSNNDPKPATPFSSTSPSSQGPQSPETPVGYPTRTASGTYFLAHLPVLQLIDHLTPKVHYRLLSHRWKEDPNIRSQNLVWRRDMDDFVLELLRKEIVKSLKYLSSRPAAYIVKCKGYESVEKSHQVVAALWLGQSTTSDENLAQTDEASDGTSTPAPEQAVPPPYAMLSYKNHHIPLYNLPHLLGPEYMHILRKLSPSHFKGQVAVLKQKRGTVELQLGLWKLMGFLGFEGKKECM